MHDQCTSQLQHGAGDYSPRSAQRHIPVRIHGLPQVLGLLHESDLDECGDGTGIRRRQRPRGCNVNAQAGEVRAQCSPRAHQSPPQLDGIMHAAIALELPPAKGPPHREAVDAYGTDLEQERRDSRAFPVAEKQHGDQGGDCTDGHLGMQQMRVLDGDAREEEPQAGNGTDQGCGAHKIAHGGVEEGVLSCFQVCSSRGAVEDDHKDLKYQEDLDAFR